MNLLEKANTTPPCFCRYVARDKSGRRGLTTKDLVAASGLSRTTIKELSFRMNWNNVTVEVATKFMEACGVNPLAARRQREFLKRRKLVHVENAIGAQRKMYARIERLTIEEAEKRKQTE